MPGDPAPDVAVLLNAQAGSDHTPPDADAVRAAFAGHGLRAAVLACTPEHALDGRLREALAARPQVLVAAGGDGTVGAVAAQALAHGLPFGVLPLGTLNHFARELGLPLELDQAVAVVAARRLRTVDVGEVNGEVFLNNASIGLYPQVVAKREYEQRHFARGKWSAMFRAAWRVLRHPEAYEIALDLEGREERRRTPAIFIGNNPYVLEGPRMGHRERLDAGVLGVVVMRPRSRLGWCWLALRALCGRLSANDMEVHEVPAFRLEAHDGALPVARDGEAHPLRPPLRFASRPRALRVCVPETP
ncbi:MAG TPA: diacylglycerol kinase family protein [Xanthomonadaceae bacterium]|nr:diacylglycerol kinase family protein [Xanthomonadaceae bacterium]